MQNLREAISDLSQKSYSNGYADGAQQARKLMTHTEDWKPVSVARGRLAQHISKLEGKTGFDDATGYVCDPAVMLREVTDTMLLEELARRMIARKE